MCVGGWTERNGGIGNCCGTYVCENNTKEKQEKNVKGDKDKLTLWY